MISLLRIDDRLLHGQVALAWSPALGVDCILVANDKVASDDFQKMALGLAKPANTKLLVKSVSDVISILNNSRYASIKMLVLVNQVKDAYLIASQVKDVKSVNFGGIRTKTGAKSISKAVSLTEEDMVYVRKLIDQNVELEIRQLPTETKQQLPDLIK